MDIKITGIEELKQKLSGYQIAKAAARAITDTAYGATLALRAEIRADIDRPTPKILNSPRFTSATPDKPSSVIYLSNEEFSTGTSHDVGQEPTPSNILRPHIIGGRRILKNSEIRLRRIGVMGEDQYIVPGPSAPKDQYGNISGPDMVKILSSAGLFTDSGYLMNQTARSRKKKTALRGVYCIPFVGIFQHTASEGLGNRRWATKYGGESVPLIFFTNTPPEYGAGRFEFYSGVKYYVKDNFSKNWAAAIARYLKADVS